MPPKKDLCHHHNIWRYHMFWRSCAINNSLSGWMLFPGWFWGWGRFNWSHDDMQSRLSNHDKSCPPSLQNIKPIGKKSQLYRVFRCVSISRSSRSSRTFPGELIGQSLNRSYFHSAGVSGPFFSDKKLSSHKTLSCHKTSSCYTTLSCHKSWRS